MKIKVFLLSLSLNKLHKNVAGRNKIGFETFDKAKIKDFTENKPDKDKDHALECWSNQPFEVHGRYATNA